jgi:hypothetical protein
MSGETTVTEDEWRECTDPQPMLKYLRGKVSDRKLRLFACACCRRLWHLYTNDICKNAVEISEEFADGVADRHELREAREAAWNAELSDTPSNSIVLLSTAKTGLMAAAHATAGRRMRTWAMAVVNSIERVAANGNPFKRRTKWNDQCNLLRDIFDNPFRSIPIINPAVLTWNDSTVVRLAQAAYDERHLPSGTLDNGRLAVLADALEEAGCTSEEILDHLRSAGPHVRGCWAVDICLRKS